MRGDERRSEITEVEGLSLLDATLVGCQCEEGVDQPLLSVSERDRFVASQRFEVQDRPRSRRDQRPWENRWAAGERRCP